MTSDQIVHAIWAVLWAAFAVAILIKKRSDAKAAQCAKHRYVFLAYDNGNYKYKCSRCGDRRSVLASQWRNQIAGCKYGGPETKACFIVSACGCRARYEGGY